MWNKLLVLAGKIDEFVGRYYSSWGDIFDDAILITMVVSLGTVFLLMIA